MTGDDLLRKTLTEHGTHISELLNSVANEHRMTIVASLIEGAADFSGLQRTTGLSKTALSHHLGILGDSGMISNPSRGRYEITEDGRTLLASIGDTYMGTVWRKEEESRRRVERFSNAYRRKKGMEVKIVELAPMRVASFRAISEMPEQDAANMLASWAKGKGTLDDLEKNPVYGFNNPNPSKGKKEYGYEFWVRMPQGFSEEGVEVKDVQGGRYAVTFCESLSIIGERWMQLLQWVKDNGHELREAYCLEKPHAFGASDAELVHDLYLAIK